MTEQPPITLDTHDIQGIILRERPTPYVGTYLLLRIDDPADGRRLLQRLLPNVTPAARWQHPNDGAWLNVGLTYAGLQRLGLPQASLDSFAPEMRAGMAARAAILSDTGDSAPAHWEPPLGSGDFHVALALFAATTEDLQGALGAARTAQHTLPGVTLAGSHAGDS
jgi:deferrochelatase/peroxidase EfeB